LENDEGILMTGLEELRVECFPQDLPEQIVIDISGLTKIGDAIFVKDVTPPANVEFLDDPEETLFVITAPAAEEIVEEAELEEVDELGRAGSDRARQTRRRRKRVVSHLNRKKNGVRQVVHRFFILLAFRLTGFVQSAPLWGRAAG
jgi:hypothetical protein